VLNQGNELNTRLADGLRHALGNVSEKLIEFGIKPRPRVVRRRRLTAQEKAVRDASRAATAAQPLTAPAPVPAGEHPPSPAA
jgi:hypothetical protein